MPVDTASGEAINVAVIRYEKAKKVPISVSTHRISVSFCGHAGPHMCVVQQHLVQLETRKGVPTCQRTQMQALVRYQLVCSLEAERADVRPIAAEAQQNSCQCCEHVVSTKQHCCQCCEHVSHPQNPREFNNPDQKTTGGQVHFPSCRCFEKHCHTASMSKCGSSLIQTSWLAAREHTPPYTPHRTMLVYLNSKSRPTDR